jgi:hypothetical protein
MQLTGRSYNLVYGQTEDYVIEYKGDRSEPPQGYDRFSSLDGETRRANHLHEHSIYLSNIPKIQRIAMFVQISLNGNYEARRQSVQALYDIENQDHNDNGLVLKVERFYCRTNDG